VVKYSAAGIPLWTNAYNGNANSADGSAGITVSPAGDVFVTGSASTVLAGVTNLACVTIAYAAPVPLSIRLLNNQGILSWNNPMFALSASPSATGPFTNISGASSPFTNTTLSSQLFFRLGAD